MKCKNNTILTKNENKCETFCLRIPAHHSKYWMPTFSNWKSFWTDPECSTLPGPTYTPIFLVPLFPSPRHFPINWPKISLSFSPISEKRTLVVTFLTSSDTYSSYILYTFSLMSYTYSSTPFLASLFSFSSRSWAIILCCKAKYYTVASISFKSWPKTWSYDVSMGHNFFWRKLVICKSSHLYYFC